MLILQKIFDQEIEKFSLADRRVIVIGLIIREYLSTPELASADAGKNLETVERARNIYIALHCIVV